MLNDSDLLPRPFNIQHGTFNIQHPTLLRVEPSSMCKVPCLRFVSFLAAIGASTPGSAAGRIPHRRAGLALLFFEIEQVVGPYRLMRQTPASRDNGGDAAASRFHPSHPDPQEVLAAVPRFASEVRRFDPAAFQILLESCRHVQYSASYADA